MVGALAPERGPWTAPSARRTGLAQRNPRLLSRLPGVFLLRLAARRLPAVLFQLPPRLTRLESLWARTLADIMADGLARRQGPTPPRVKKLLADR